MPTRNINSDLKVNADLTLPNLPTYSGSEVTTLMIAGADVVGKRDLGTNAFNSTSFLPLTGGTMTGALAMGNQNITGGGSFFANLFSVGNEGKVVSTSTLGLQLQATGSQKPIIFSTNDGGMTERMRVHTDGKVGIAITDPDTELEVGGTIKASTHADAIVIGSPTTVKWKMGVYGANDLLIRDPSNNTKLSILSGGNVGIGTASPSHALDVESSDETVASFNSTDNKCVIALNDDDTTVYLSAENGRGSFGFQAGTHADNLNINSSGNVGIGAASLTQKLNVEGNTPVIQIRETSGAAEAGISINHAVSGNHVNFFIGTLDGNARKLTIGGTITDGHSTNTAQAAASLMLIDEQTGNVGIGETDPTSKLHIEENGGRVRIGSPTTSWGGVGFAGSLTAANAALWGTATKTNIGAVGSGSIEMKLGNDAGGNGSLKMEADKLYYTGGNLGIGTTSPDHELHVKGDVTIDNESSSEPSMLHFNALNKTNHDPTARINFWEGDGHTGAYTGSHAYIEYNGSSAGGGDGYLAIGGNTNAGANSDIIVINRLGRVGIAITDPDTELEVGGTIKASTHSDAIVIGSPTTVKWKMGVYGANDLLIRDPSNNTKFSILSSGNVGIGTASPNQKFEVSGGNINIQNGDGGFLTFENGSANITIHHNSSGTDGRDLSFKTWKSGVGNTEKMRIDKDGNVGIGTTSPNALLHVSHATAPTFRLSRTGTGQIWQQSIDSSGRLLINEAASEGGTQYTRLAIDDDGNVGIGTTSPSYKLDVDSGAVNDARIRVKTGDNNAGAYFQARSGYDGFYGLELFYQSTPKWYIGGYGVNRLGFFAGSKTTSTNEKMSLTTAGNLGIGTTSPNQKLDVRGALLVAGDTPNAPVGSTLEVYRNGSTAELAIHQDDASASSTFSQIRFRNGGNDTYIKVPPSSSGLIIDVESKTNAFVIGITGNVGIGTASPSYKLSVSGGDFGVPNGNKVYIGGAIGDSVIGYLGNTSGKLTLNSDGNRDVIIGSGTDTDAVFIKGTNGNVGIGETAPEVKLEVAGDIMAKDSFVSAGATASQGYTFHDFGTGWGYKGVQSPSRLGMFTASAERVTIDSDGKVGIGTTSPSQKLHVEGNIELTSGFQIGSNSGSYWQRIRTEDATPSTTNAFNFETRNGSGSFIKHVVIRNDGNVGVGNATPAAKLAVEGTIAHKVYTVATLPSASPAGQRAFVSDSSYSVSDAHGLVTVGSGSNFCPMYSDGTNWRVG